LYIRCNRWEGKEEVRNVGSQHGSINSKCETDDGDCDDNKAEIGNGNGEQSDFIEAE
jgi:hypothetical protein